MGASWRLFLFSRHLALVSALAPALSRPRRMTHLPTVRQAGRQTDRHIQIQVTGRQTNRHKSARTEAYKERQNERSFAKSSNVSVKAIQVFTGLCQIVTWLTEQRIVMFESHLYERSKCTLVNAVFSS